MQFTFKSKEDCTSFLGKMLDNAWTPDDIFRHCSNLHATHNTALGVALGAEVELGEIKVMDNSVGTAVFSAGFQAELHTSSTVERDAAAQTISVEQTDSGALSLSLSIGKADTEEKSRAEQREESAETASGNADSALATAQGSGSVEVGDTTRAVFGLGTVLNADASFEDSALTLTASLAASRTSTVTRSTRADSPSLLLEASHGVELQFNGRYCLTQFETYARKNVHMQESAIQEMRATILAQTAGMDDAEFTLRVAYSLKGEQLDECRECERTHNRGKVEELLHDENNYQLSGMTLEFRPRSAESSRFLGVGLGDSLQLGVQLTAEAEERIRFDYDFSGQASIDAAA